MSTILTPPPVQQPQPASIQGIWNICWDVVTNHCADFTGTASRRTYWTYTFARVCTWLRHTSRRSH